MSIAGGFPTIRVLLNNIAITQPSGVWSGNTTPVTYLNRGTYICNFNVSYIVSGTGPITNTQTQVSLYDTPGGATSQVICSSPQTGQMGLAGTNAMRQTISNTFQVTADQVPVYVYLNCVLTGATWGTVYPSELNLSILTFTQIGF
jgi:hypothetical protein